MTATQAFEAAARYWPTGPLCVWTQPDGTKCIGFQHSNGQAEVFGSGPTWEWALGRAVTAYKAGKAPGRGTDRLSGTEPAGRAASAPR